MAFISEDDALLFGAPAARVSVFLLIKAVNTSPPTWIRLWSGVGDRALPVDAIETQGGTYTGIGDLVGMPALSQLINGVAERVEFTLSGATADIVALADSEADSVRNVPVHIALVAFDEDYQRATAPVWVWEGESDVPRISRAAGEDLSVVRTISLSVGSVFTGRRRPRQSYYNGVQQRARSADDAFCDRANTYSLGTTRKWPA